MKIVTTLFLCVAITISQACEEELATKNAGDASNIKTESETTVNANSAIVDNLKNELQNLSPQEIEEYNSLVARAKLAAAHAKSYTDTLKQWEAGVRARARIQVAKPRPRTDFRSMENRMKGANMQHAAVREHTYPQPGQRNQMNNEAEITKTGQNQVHPVSVDADAIIQNAKMAIERTKNLPSSFKEWEEHVQRKFEAAKDNFKHLSEEVANKNGLPQNIKLASSQKDLENEIEAEGKIAAARPQPYLKPFEDRSDIAAKQAETMHAQPMSYPQSQKEWEAVIMARINALKTNPKLWEEIKERVEKKAKMSAPRPQPVPYHRF